MRVEVIDGRIQGTFYLHKVIRDGDASQHFYDLETSDYSCLVGYMLVSEIEVDIEVPRVDEIALEVEALEDLLEASESELKQHMAEQTAKHTVIKSRLNSLKLLPQTIDGEYSHD